MTALTVGYFPLSDGKELEESLRDLKLYRHTVRASSVKNWEYRESLRKYHIEFDERYVWD